MLLLARLRVLPSCHPAIDGGKFCQLLALAIDGISYASTPVALLLEVVAVVVSTATVAAVSHMEQVLGQP